MNRVVVRLLLWCLFAALPLQGYAAALRLCCAPAPAAVMKMDSSARSMAHCHDDGAGKAHAKADGAQGKTSHDCGYNGCLGACAPPVDIAVAAVLHHGAVLAAAPAALFSGHIPAGLERPPKSRIA